MLYNEGNCLFRSINDQIEGSMENHFHYRNQIVDHIEDNKEYFEPYEYYASFLKL